MKIKPKARQSRASDQKYGLRILYAVRRIIRAIDLDSRQLAANHQTTAPQLLTLMAIVENGPTTAIALVDRIQLDASTLVGVIDRLEAKGLIKRERDSKDRRQVWIRITKSGQALVAQTPFPLQYSLERALVQMSEGERSGLAQSLERLANLITAPNIDPSPPPPLLEILGKLNSRKSKD